MTGKLLTSSGYYAKEMEFSVKDLERINWRIELK